ncbi:MAG TPA: hypothetical protein VNO33_03535 [Kofleriaceae bacterium]|nr:hypothetical protein [Kofleriaceae bacterium]
MKAARSSRRAIRIVSQCATAEEFVASFHPYLERDSLFIATGSPEEPGQSVRFVMTLAGGETVLRGAGRVLECHRDRGNFYGLRGMKLKFDELDDGSRRALAALESRAGGRSARSAAAGQRPNDVLECLIYDDPETESADPAAMNSRRRPARPGAERGLPPPGDDDVTAVSQAPRQPRPSPTPAGPGRGTGPVPRMGNQQRTTGPLPLHVQQHQTPAPPPPPGAPGHGPQGMSFAVPRPRTEQDPGLPEAVAAHGRVPSGRMAAMAGDVSDMPTDMLPAVRPRAAMPPPPPGQAGPVATPSPVPPQSSGSGPLHDYDHTEPSRPRIHGPGEELGPGPRHMLPPEMTPFPQGEFGSLTQTGPGVRRGVPRPPMPAERTEIVRFARPRTFRTAALSATLGALIGLGAGFMIWGMDHSAFSNWGDTEEPEPAETQPPPEAARPQEARPAEPEPRPAEPQVRARSAPTPGSSEEADEAAATADAGTAAPDPEPR